ncbi:MAG: histidine kinase dimerization/phospho-acceptor domain-containing protein [Dehalococcoidia bacterium]
MGLSLVEREREQWVIRLALAGGGGLGIALTALGAFFLTGRALAPVEASMSRQRRFVSDASHELRTPLALLRLELEREPALEREARRPLLRQIDRLGRMVEDLLLLARVDEGALPLEREPVPVADLLRTAADEARRLAPDARVSLEGGGEAWVNSDADRLHQALLVLIDNAARVTPAGESIALEGRVDGGFVEIAVIDGGPGVPREHAGQVFERFYRADKARASAGRGRPRTGDRARHRAGAWPGSCLDNPGRRTHGL